MNIGILGTGNLAVTLGAAWAIFPSAIPTSFLTTFRRIAAMPTMVGRNAKRTGTSTGPDMIAPRLSNRSSSFRPIRRSSARRFIRNARARRVRLPRRSIAADSSRPRTVPGTADRTAASRPRLASFSSL